MIRLPPTSIDISQSDLQTQLQHLDFCAGLLKQGFKKHEIIHYFRKRSNPKEPPAEGTSTYDLLSRFEESEESSDSVSSACQNYDNTSQAQFASPIQSPEDASTSNIAVGKKTYAPRQSSLLRFARGVSSSEASENGTNTHFSPRSNITYRPRSKTYSYDQSELDEEDLMERCSTPTDQLKLDHLSLDDGVVTGSTDHTTVQLTSNLRPDARPFTPFHIRQAVAILEGPSTASSGRSSFPSPPPQNPDRSSSPSLPFVPRTPPPRTARIPSTVNARSQQQFLDGSFTVYNDSVPARSQPQTPAELDRGQFLSQYIAAYTAPPGMIRSSAARQGTNSNRQASGELSPTAQAHMLRERRQREFARGLRVEGLRIDRSRTDTRRSGTGSGNDVDPFSVWRDDLDADGVGEENFEEASAGPMLRGMRVVSGNRRPA